MLEDKDLINNEDIKLEIIETDEGVLTEITSEEAEPIIQENNSIEEETVIIEEETQEQVVKPMIMLSEEQYQDLKLSIKQYYESVVKYVSNVKTKDDAIYNINKELQAFKNDFYYQLLKPLVSDIIELRESCKKTISDIDTYHFGKEDCLKNGAFILEEIENLLMMNEVELKEGIYYYGNREIFPNQTSIEYFGVEDLSVAINEEGFVDNINEDYEAGMEGILQQLNCYQKNIERIYDKNEKLVQTIIEQRKIIKQQQEICNGKLTIPLLLKIVNINEYSSKQFTNLKLLMDNEEVINSFKRVLAHVVSMIGGLLQGCGIFVKDNIDNVLDMKYHKVIKMIKISPEEAEKEKTIERFYTDCYIYNEKVIYPAKVNIYKL